MNPCGATLSNQPVGIDKKEEILGAASFSGKDVKSIKLLKIIELANQESGPGYNNYIYCERFKDINEFKIISCEQKEQAYNGGLLDPRSEAESVIYVATAIRRCNAVIIRNPDNGVSYMYHIDQDQCSKWQDTHCKDLVQFLEGNKPQKWIDSRQQMVVVNVMANPSNDKFTNDPSLYASYNVIKPFELKYVGNRSASAKSEAERFHVFYDTETCEFLCINNRGDTALYSKSLNPKIINSSSELR